MVASEMDSKWCSLPWHHLMINPGGWVRPCCRFLLEELPIPAMHIRDGIDATLGGPYMTQLRNDILTNDYHPGCRKCYDEETAKKTLSHRQRSNRDLNTHDEIKIEQPKLTFLEVSFSNKCNLACRMCHPEYSTKWYADYSQLVGEDFRSAYSYQFNINHYREVIRDLKYIKFTGGEPLLIKEYEEILDAAIEMGVAKNIYLNYSTNLTILPNRQLIEKWTKFKGIVFALSLDGIGPVIEYVRYPTKWETVAEVVPSLLRLSNELPATYSFRASVMPYNVLNIPDTISWWQNQVDENLKNPTSKNNIINPTHIHYPEFLTLRVLPLQVKDLISQRLLASNTGPEGTQAIRHLVNYMNEEDDSRLLPQFVSFTRSLDKLRGQSFFEVCPEIAEHVSLSFDPQRLPNPTDFVLRNISNPSDK